MSLLNNLVAFYECEEADGADLTDSHTGSKTMTQNNSPGTAAGIISKSRTGNGSNRYFSRTSEAAFEPGSSSIWGCAWIYVTSIGSAHGIISKYSGTNGWTLRISGAGKLNFQARTSGAVTTVINSTATLSINTWYFCAGGWESSSGHAWVSLNGGAKEYDTATITEITANALPAVVGRVTGSTDYLNGRLDQIGLWIGSDPTGAELSYLYNSGTARSYSDLSASGRSTQTSTFGGKLGHISHYLEKAQNPNYDLLCPKPIMPRRT